MKVSLNWLKEMLPLTRSVPEIVEALTFAGIEVEGVQQPSALFEKVIVAQIESFEPHPNADRLSVCRVNDGSGLPRQVVCGAKNFRAGDKVPLALPGALLPDGVKIQAGKLRGVESEGMLCSSRELKVAEDAAGLLILPREAPLGAPLSDIYPPDTLLEIEVTPNRPDLLSHYGIARDLSALLNLPPAKVPEISAISERVREDPGVVKLEAPEGCPFYIARVIRGIRVGPSPGWLRQKLEAAGLRSINNVIDVTNFVLLELGQPLHAFDLANIRGGIIVRMANPGERLLALDEKEYELHPDDLVIADHERALAIAGVMGGQQSGVATTTIDILLEAAYFNPGFIRRTSRRLGLISESSFRFERGVDPGAVMPASCRAMDLVLEVGGGKADESVVIGGSIPPWNRVVEMRPERCNKLLGVKVPDSAQLLARLGLKDAGENRWRVPSYRQDLAREADLIEEVCRMAGIQKIPSRLFGSATESSPSDRAYDDLMQLRQRLVGLGLFEARSLALMDERGLEYTMEPTSNPLRLRNPLTEDQKVLRPSLVPGLVRAAERNLNRGSSSVAIFEIGRVFKVATQEESVSLAVLVCGERQSKSWNQGATTFDLFDLKGILKAALSRDLIFFREQPTSFAPLLCGMIDGEGNSIGKIGQLRPSLAKEIGARNPVLVTEVTIAPSANLKRFRYRALDRFPAVARDVAFLADKELKYQSVLDAFGSANEPLLVDVQLFDLFVDPSGEKVPMNKKSIACSLTYRATDRTLTQEEANAAHSRLKSQLVERLGVALRE
ncbi:MAG: phenylalanine--tRNA ligase subunit beta [Verrucomicrobia bacterium]|nr:phenylalanine--tRNA ligase subunit beta [Verrucomicrobiota bacterium]